MLDWDDIYSSGKQLNKHPFDSVISFIYNHKPNKSNQEINILEIGSGTGNNLIWAAKEGFNVHGVELSETAYEFAKKRFQDENLIADIRYENILDLSFPDNYFDLVIDRAAISYIGELGAYNAVTQVKRVLKPGGKFQSELYTTPHQPKTGPKCGHLYSLIDVKNLFKYLQILSIQMTEVKNVWPNIYDEYGIFKILATKE